MLTGNTMCNKVDILGIDLGTYNTKSSRGYIEKSSFTTNLEYNIGNNGMIELDGRKYLIGGGKFDTEIIKSKRDNLPLFLYALSKSTQASKVNVVVGLPHYQLKSDVYINELKNKFIGHFNFICDNINREIEVLNVKIFPEGVGAYYTITKDLTDKEVIVIDIGGSTFNIVWFSNGELMDIKTLPFGSHNLLTLLTEKIMALHGGRVDIELAAKYVQRGRVGKTDDAMPYIIDLAQPYIDNLKNTLELNFPVNDAEYYLTGGGVQLFSECIIRNLGDLHLISDYLFANANGFEKIGRVIWNG